MRGCSQCLLAILVLTASACGAPVRFIMTSRTPHSPVNARISYQDVDRFAAALARLDSTTDTASVMRWYLAGGTDGLRAYAQKFRVTDSTLREALRRRPEYYRSLRDLPQRLRAVEPQVRGGLTAMERLYAGTVYPTVYYVVGTGRAGGQASRQGVLVGAEIFAASADSTRRDAQRTPRSFRTLDELPALVVHETVHYNHFTNAPITYSRHWNNLERALKEGAADFIAEQATGRQTLTVAARAFGDAHEASLWREFQSTLDSKEPAPWFFTPPPEGRPQDLGYYLGYRMVRAFHARQGRSADAIRSIMQLHDYRGFFERSGYRP